MLHFRYQGTVSTRPNLDFAIDRFTCYVFVISRFLQADAPAAVKSSYSVKLQKFDDSKKVALIKEIKSLLTDLNLVQVRETKQYFRF